jgi:hypothetical protein
VRTRPTQPVPRARLLPCVKQPPPAEKSHSHHYLPPMRQRMISATLMKSFGVPRSMGPAQQVGCSKNRNASRAQRTRPAIVVRRGFPATYIRRRRRRVAQQRTYTVQRRPSTPYSILNLQPIQFRAEHEHRRRVGRDVGPPGRLVRIRLRQQTRGAVRDGIYGIVRHRRCRALRALLRPRRASEHSQGREGKRCPPHRNRSSTVGVPWARGCPIVFIFTGREVSQCCCYCARLRHGLWLEAIYRSLDLTVTIRPGLLDGRDAYMPRFVCFTLGGSPDVQTLMFLSKVDGSASRSH